MQRRRRSTGGSDGILNGNQSRLAANVLAAENTLRATVPVKAGDRSSGR